MAHNRDTTKKRFAICGLPNLIDVAGRSHSVGGSAVAALPASNISTEEPSEVARVSILDPRHTVFSTIFSDQTGDAWDVNMMACVNHNALPPPHGTTQNGAGQFRFIGAKSIGGISSNTYEDVVGYSRLAPDAITASTNITGGVTNVDESPAAPDGALVAPTTTGSAWSARFSFPTPTATPRVGSQLQCFVLYHTFTDAGAISWWPSLTVKLFEGSTEVADLGTRYFAADGYSVWAWDASLLSTANGSAVEVEVSSTPVGGNYLALDAISWDCERGTLFQGAEDSGWLDIPGGFLAPWDGDRTPRVDDLPPTASFHYIPTTGWENITALHLAFRAPSFLVSNHDNLLANAEKLLPTHLDVGVVCAGAAFLALYGAKYGAPPTYSITSEPVGVNKTAGGQNYTADLYRYRSVDVTLLLTRDEMRSLTDRLDWRKGRTGAFYVALEPAVDLNYQLHSAFWATLDGEPGAVIPEVMAYYENDEMLFNRAYRFVEKL